MHPGLLSWNLLQTLYIDESLLSRDELASYE